MDNKKIAKVFAFVNELAVALRMNSDYTSDVGPHAANDVMWLSDALHNMSFIGNAIEDSGEVIRSMDLLTSVFREYLEPKGQYKSVALDTFTRWDIDIVGAINLFESLKR